MLPGTYCTVSLFVYSSVGGGTHESVRGGTHDTYVSTNNQLYCWWVVVRMIPYVPPKKQLYRRGYPMKSRSAADARQNQLQKRVLQALPPAVPLAITPTFRPWTHTSDDSYIYQLSLVVATATASFNNTQVYTKYRSRVFYVLSL